jgi:hypothetical protein
MGSFGHYLTSSGVYVTKLSSFLSSGALWCPLHDHGLNTGNASSFTDFFIDGMKSCKLAYYHFLETFVLTLFSSLKLMSQQASSHSEYLSLLWTFASNVDGTRRYPMSRVRREGVTTFGLATVIELLVALNVFNIHVAATVGFTLTITMRSGALDALCTWVRPLLGDVYRAPWHPRVFSGLPFMGMGHQDLCVWLIRSDLWPILDQKHCCPKGHGRGHPDASSARIFPK